MLNTQNTLADILLPGNAGRELSAAGNGQNKSSGLFGETLGDQMKGFSRTSQSERNDTKTADKKVNSSAKPAEKEKTGAEGTERASAVNDKKITSRDADEPESAASVEEDSEIVDVTLQPLDDASGEEEIEWLAEEFADGNILPDEADDEGNALPIWLAGQNAGMESVRDAGGENELQAGKEKSSIPHNGAEPLIGGSEKDFTEKGTGQERLADSLQKALRTMTDTRDVLEEVAGKPQQDMDKLFRMVMQQAGRESAAAPISATAANVAAASATGTAQAVNPAANLSLVQNQPVEVPVRQPGWDQAMSERVVWLARQGIQEARIQLNPRHLGPIEVHVSVNKEQQATVHFLAQHAVTREALDNAMPRLREMLQENGLQMGESSVSQHGERQQQEQAAEFAPQRGGGPSADATLPEGEGRILAETPLQDGLGLDGIDYYA